MWASDNTRVNYRQSLARQAAWGNQTPNEELH